jgi:hypothetical protein
MVKIKLKHIVTDPTRPDSSIHKTETKRHIIVIIIIIIIHVALFPFRLAAAAVRFLGRNKRHVVCIVFVYYARPHQQAKNIQASQQQQQQQQDLPDILQHRNLASRT